MKRIVKNKRNLFEIYYIFTNNTPYIYLNFQEEQYKSYVQKSNLTVHTCSNINLPRKKNINKMKEIVLVPLKKEHIDGPCTDIRDINTSTL